MACNHDKVRCTDGIFYCLLCGQRIDYPPADEEMHQAENKPEKKAVKAVKRKGKKEGYE
ncbi:MAG: hypothetical protein IKR85_10300 [Clostridia bacterium]|nr:hypothetical protein [Clostridia bacterium]